MLFVSEQMRFMQKNKIEVCYALKDKQYLIEVNLNENIKTIKDAIIQSGILEHESNLVLDELKVGIFSKLKSLDDQISSGDRVEIYRPLTINPMEARRIRAENKRKKEKLGLFGA